jgi:hypothetical protein
MAQRFGTIVSLNRMWCHMICLGPGLDDSVGEEEAGLPPSTAPPRLEDPRTRGKTPDFVALHTGAANKKTKQWQ